MAPGACQTLAKRTRRVVVAAAVPTPRDTVFKQATIRAPPALASIMPPVQMLQETSALLAAAPWGTPELPAKQPPAHVTGISANTEALARVSLVALPASVLKDTPGHPVKLTLTNAFPALASTERCVETMSVATPATASQATKGSIVTWK